MQTSGHASGQAVRLREVIEVAKPTTAPRHYLKLFEAAVCVDGSIVNSGVGEPKVTCGGFLPR